MVWSFSFRFGISRPAAKPKADIDEAANKSVSRTNDSVDRAATAPVTSEAPTPENTDHKKPEERPRLSHENDLITRLRARYGDLRHKKSWAMEEFNPDQVAQEQYDARGEVRKLLKEATAIYNDAADFIEREPGKKLELTNKQRQKLIEPIAQLTSAKPEDITRLPDRLILELFQQVHTKLFKKNNPVINPTKPEVKQERKNTTFEATSSPDGKKKLTVKFRPDLRDKFKDIIDNALKTIESEQAKRASTEATDPQSPTVSNTSTQEHLTPKPDSNGAGYTKKHHQPADLVGDDPSPATENVPGPDEKGDKKPADLVGNSSSFTASTMNGNKNSDQAETEKEPSYLDKAIQSIQCGKEVLAGMMGCSFDTTDDVTKIGAPNPTPTAQKSRNQDVTVPGP
ncbi:MAG: hypothetical protein AAF195_00200 [Pseudomonadota bacterium]